MKNIYIDVKNSIKDLQKIFENTDGGDERLRAFNQEALEEFKKLESESLKELESLKNNEEWEKFTIAFYGETGAGKSTLIECLRLFFKEPSKMDQQERFKRLYANVKNSNYVKNYRGSEHAELEKLQDGAIIGDGRSDFTLETKSYTLKHNNQSFVLLDVPGIEGDEKKVKQQISNATKKAHAIFYVTKTPTPPQKGEEGKEGTIEKIQKQLDSQTEVYTLFNKPINSPRALKDGLIDENEKESLRDLNEKMKAILGKHYEGHKAVSAQAAFYGLSSALLPENDFYKNKQKFLDFFKAEESLLLYKCRFQQLGEFITEELLENSHAKIIQSNCNKALKVVEELQNTIKTMIEKQIDPMIKKTQEHQQEAHSNLDRSTDKFISDLKNSVLSKINQFESDFRKEMHERIERGIGNNECKEIFDNELIQRQTKLIEDIERRFKECEERFDEQIKEDIERFKEEIKDSLAIIKRINNPSLNPNSDFNTDSGIDTIGLFSSIGGLVLLLLTPVVGEFALIAGVGLALVGAVKAVWNVFNPDYKKSQQKEAVNESLNKACEKIAENVKSRIESVKKDIWEKIEKLKADLNRPIENYEYKKERLKDADKRLGYISNDIKTRSMQ
ncbi:50S ribosome-binding GTPase [Helicobacter pylori]|nr:50S ribosome-binding GTPase [Helicobacter pylori]